METSLRFRRVGAEEADVLSLLWSQANARWCSAPAPSAADPERVAKLRERLQRPGSIAIVGEHGRVPVACCFATRLVLADGSESTKGAHISGFAVAPEHWGKGYGETTLAFFERLLATVGYEFAQLHVLETNSRARRLYERRDWRFVSAGHPHADGDQAVYEKQLQQEAHARPHEHRHGTARDDVRVDR